MGFNDFANPHALFLFTLYNNIFQDCNYTYDVCTACLQR